MRQPDYGLKYLDIFFNFCFLACKYLFNLRMKFFYLSVCQFLLVGLINNIYAQSTIVRHTGDTGTGSLREAITILNETDGGTITFADELAGDTIVLESPLPDVITNITIDGNGITLSGNDQHQIMHIYAATTTDTSENITVAISRVHFTRGRASDNGGAIHNSGTLILQSCIFSYNQTTGYDAWSGAIYNDGNLTISGCTFYNNIANGSGGALYNKNGHCVLTGNLFYINYSDNGSDIVYNFSGQVISGGYNVYDRSSEDFHFDAPTDQSCTTEPVSPLSFRLMPGSEAIDIIPPATDLPSYPNIDFYGTPMDPTNALSAGAVQGKTAPGYILTRTPRGYGRIDITSGPAPDSEGIIVSGSIITLQATPTNGRVFQYWIINDIQYQTSSTFTLTMDGHKNVEAIFGREITVLTAGNDGEGSLRNILELAEEYDHISFDNRLAGDTIELESPLPDICKNLTIDGNGITLSGKENCQIMYIYCTDIVVSISRVRFINGKADDYGGAIYNHGKLILKSCIFSNNQTSRYDAWGGAIYSVGYLAASGCTFLGNTTYGLGGAICNKGGSGILTGNIFCDNYAKSGSDVVHQLNGDISSGGYNVFDGTSQGFVFNKLGDKQLAAYTYPVSPVSFRLTYDSEAAGIITSATQLNFYPTVDFYGNTINPSSAVAAGAVQNKTAQGHVLTLSSQGAGTVLIQSGNVPDSDGIVASGSKLTLLAVPARNRMFMYWIVNGKRDVETSPTLVLTMNSDKSVQAVFGRETTVTTHNNDGAGSLRTILNNAEDGDHIRFADALAGDTIVLSSPLPDIIVDLTIEGNGITLSGNGQHRIMYIYDNNASVAISRIHFTKAYADDYGGAIYNHGTLMLQTCIFSNNHTTGDGAWGGAVYNAGSLTVAGCTFYADSTKGFGGAFYNWNGNCTSTGNLFFGNHATYDGNIIYNSGNAISGGYNAYDGESNNFTFDIGKGDNQVLNKPIDTINFVPTLTVYEQLHIVPSGLAKFPATDFYGIMRGVPTTAGAVVTSAITVTFNTQDGNPSNVIRAEANTLLVAPTMPVRNGFTAIWYKEASYINKWDFANDLVTRDTTLYAKWINTCTVTLNANGGTVNTSQVEIPYDTALGELPVPTRTGYTFTGWNTSVNGSGTTFTANTNITTDVALYAQWLITTYTVTFDANGGEINESDKVIKVEYGHTIIFPAVSYTGYIFAGWYNASVLWDYATPVTTNITLTVKWVDASTPTFTVTFAGENIDVTAQTIAKGEPVIRPVDPVRAGYNFNGWYNGTTLWDFTTPVTADLTLTAQWTGDAPSGYHDLSLINTKLYPNPFTGNIHIIGAEGGLLRVMNSVGAVVYIRKLTSDDENINLEQLPLGMYFFHLEKDGKTKVIKGIKE